MRYVLRRCSFLYLLLVALVVNAAGWTFNAEVLEEPGSGERTVLAQSTDGALPADGDTPTTAKGTCNHGCHAVNHLLGQISCPLVVAAMIGAVPLVAELSSAFLSRALGAQFRPPRFASLA